MIHFRQFFRNETGASAAEFALVLPLVLILVFAPIAAGVMMYTVVKLQHATETSARCLSAQRDDCSLDDITTYATGYYTGPAIDGLTFAAAWDSDNNCYSVTATGTFNFFMGQGLLSFPVGTQACYPGFNASA
jgi:Flp pilus assembly protein TadG